MNEATIPLFHGTSTLFLDGIVRSGLGGINPILEWKILEFARSIYPLVQEHLAREEEFVQRTNSFGYMVEQRSGAWNFQHGETYLSPSFDTAIKYAANTRYSSELLSYTLDFLSELLRRKVPGVSGDLYRRYPRIFNFLDISVAPILIEVSLVPVGDLASESGGDALETWATVRRLLQDTKGSEALQQLNFRLRKPVPAENLKISLLNVTCWDPFNPAYTLYELSGKTRLGTAPKRDKHQ
jgi:hypothetical protein